MRDIKYRQWNGKKFTYWGFIDEVFVTPSTMDGAHLIEPSQQFTGLYDRNGKEIYEGDIIENKENNIMRWPRIVEYNSEWCAFVFRNMDSPQFLDGKFLGGDENSNEPIFQINYLAAVEIIGNIYENPDLLP